MLRIGVPQYKAGYDPYLLPAEDIAELGWINGRGLVTMSGSGLRPEMAARVPTIANGDVQSDFRRITYWLREDVRWHDGARFSAADVVACFERFIGSSPIGSATIPYKNIADITVSGKDSCVVRLHRSDPTFVATFFSAYGLLPIPLLRAGEQGTIGTGPFTMIEASGTQLRFRRGDARAPHEIVIRFFGDSQSAAVAFQAGEIDAIVPVDRTIARTARIPTVLRSSGSIYVLANTSRLSRDQRAALLSHLNLHEVARKVYETAIADEIAPGIHVSVRGGVEQAGDIRLCFVDTPAQKTVAEMLQQELQEHGYAVELRMLPLASYEIELRQGDFDVAILGERHVFAADLAGEFTCSNRAPKGANVARLCDARLDRAIQTNDGLAVGRLLSQDSVLRVIAPYQDHAVFAPRVFVPNPRQAFVPWFHDLDRWAIS